MAEVVVTGLTKRLGGQTAVQELTISIQNGEAVSLLGPSGCGKTTTLNLLAGFLTPDAGTILVDGRSMVGVPPEKRGIGFVFQNYALFPHMHVADNVGFGLKMRKASSSHRRRRVAETLELVGLQDKAKRLPRELSGGQQQRVALARALAFEPTLLLLDEPLSNLDAKLRQGIREEISRIHRETGVTMIFVTHDQEEALTIADRVAVMDLGQLIQVGTPEEIYQRPNNRFVADFVGKANFFPITAHNEGGLLSSHDLQLKVCDDEVRRRAWADGDLALVRPETVTLNGLGNTTVGANRVKANVVSAVFCGPVVEYRLRAGHRTLQVISAGGPHFRPGDDVVAEWQPSDVHIVRGTVADGERS